MFNDETKVDLCAHKCASASPSERTVNHKERANSGQCSMIYLDNNATTVIDKAVRQSMIDHLKSSESFGNPSCSHSFGARARISLDEAREHVRSCINASSANEILFTSGGTESNNLAIEGVLRPNLDRVQHVITSPFEHPSVANVLDHLERSSANIQVSRVNVDSNGTIDLEHFVRLLRPETRLVTIMHSNNEIGSIQPIAQLVDLCRKYGSATIIVHSDASQSVGKVPVDVSELGVDLLTICAHKFHGPKGIGALFVRQGVKLKPILHGAQQERSLRPGTENLLSILGLGKACQLIANRSVLNKRISRMRRARDRLLQGLVDRFSVDGLCPIVRNGNGNCLPNTLSVTFSGVDGKRLVSQLANQVAFSTGSACHEDQQVASTTLTAIGVSPQSARSTVRLTTSYTTSDDEVDNAVLLIADGVKQQLYFGDDRRRGKAVGQKTGDSSI